MSDRPRAAAALRWLALAALLLALPSPAGALSSCVVVGDCDVDGTVTVEELVQAVRIVLDGGVAADCPAFACEDLPPGSECLARAVRAALERPTLGVKGTERIDVGGYRLRIKCLGSGGPTVVFDAGLGDILEAWAPVQPVVARFTRACAFDRAGDGSSDPGPLPRTSRQIVAEMHALLGNGCVPGPYILVGHSFGGLDIHLYASTYPEDIAGLVFVEGRPAGFDAALRALEPPLPPDLFALYVECAGYTKPTAAAECASIGESEAQVAAAAPLPPVPMTVLVAGQGDVGIPPEVDLQIEAKWLELQTALADSVSGSQLAVLDECMHYIQYCRPDLITASIRDMVESGRTNPGGPRDP